MHRHAPAATTRPVRGAVRLVRVIPVATVRPVRGPAIDG